MQQEHPGAPPRLYVILCKTVAQVVANETLLGMRNEELKMERLCQFIGEEAFRTKTFFGGDNSFNANTMSLCMTHIMIAPVAAYMRKK